MTLWTIRTEEGDVLGQEKAINPKIALIVHLSAKSAPGLSDLKLTKVSDDEYRIRYGRKKFLVSSRAPTTGEHSKPQ
ncbi:MAG: hypothetical protein JO314_11385 [Acidobacteria bacterium]|nr:hypothetical protein [Acidobacteriota bacterium]